MNSKKLSKQQKQRLNEHITALFVPLQAVQHVAIPIRHYTITDDLRTMRLRITDKKGRPVSDKTLAKLMIAATIVGTFDIVLLFAAVLVK